MSKEKNELKSFTLSLLICVIFLTYQTIRTNNYYNNVKDESQEYSNFGGMVTNYSITFDSKLYYLDLLLNDSLKTCTYYNYYKSSNYSLVYITGENQLGNDGKYSIKNNKCFDRKKFYLNALERFFIFCCLYTILFFLIFIYCLYSIYKKDKKHSDEEFSLLEQYDI